MAYLLQHRGTSTAQLPVMMYVSKEKLRLIIAGGWPASDVILIATCCSADATSQLHAVQLALLCILLVACLCGAASQLEAASIGCTI